MEYTDEQCLTILRGVHDLGHFGQKIMENSIKFTFGHVDFPNLSKKVKEFLSTCEACAEVNRGAITFALPTRPNPQQPMEHLYYDIMEMPRSRLGHTKILITVDYFAKFILRKEGVGQEH